MSARFLRQLCGFSLGALVLSTSGCNTSSCDRGEDSATVAASPDHIVDGVYYSAPYGGPYQDFPGGRTMHFMHGLGKVPLAPVFWLGFSARSPSLALSAGNEAELVSIDDQEIAVKNDTCSDFYIWFYAQPAP